MYKKQHCLACGNNPTSHLLAWIGQNLIVISSHADQRLGKSFLHKPLVKLSNGFFLGVIHLLRALGGLTENTDIEKVVCLRGKCLWEEAKRRGIPMKSFVVFDKPVDVYTATVAGRKIYFNGLPRPHETKSGAEVWMDDKALLKERLLAAGLPVARGGIFTAYEPLFEKFKTLDKPVIIKPRLGSRGRHTTTHITTEKQLEEAFHSAKKLCYWVVLEEHLVGSVYRGTVIDGKLAGILRGDPPRITGDGVHTIAELIEIKNKTKLPIIHDVNITDAHVAFLSRLGLTPDSILENGRRIDVLEKIGISYGGHSAEETPITHPKIKAVIEAAGRVVDDPIIGFDFIIEHISEDPDTQKWGIIECNGLPFINLHHYPVEGTPVNVAKQVWDYAEAHIDEVA